MVGIRDAFLSLIEDVRGIEDHELTVGIEDDEENATKLVGTELGIPAGDTSSVPAQPGGEKVVPRPALSRAWDESSADVLTMVETGILEGKPVRVALEEGGDRLVEKFNQNVDARVVAPLRPSTVAKRRAAGKDDKPLDDTGKMREAVKRRVRPS